jgi:hypothetical protein
VYNIIGRKPEEKGLLDNLGTDGGDSIKMDLNEIR